MTTKFRIALASLALMASGMVHAAIIDLGTITAPETVAFGNGWVIAPPVFSDEFTFSLTNAASAYGAIVEGDWKYGGVDVQLLALASNSYLSFDLTPGSFAFSGLGAGDYSMFVSGYAGGFLTGYGGKIRFVPSATSVPEPGTLALLGLGLVGVALARRRRPA